MVRPTLVWTAAACLLAVAACQAPMQQAGDLSEEDIAAIKANLDGVAQAELDRDWQGVAAFLTEDFVSMPADMPAVEGRDAWLDVVRAMDWTVSDLAVEYLEIGGSGDVAFVRGKYSETVAMGDSEPMNVVGKFLWIYEKQPDGRWLASIAMGNSDAPLPGPE